MTTPRHTSSGHTLLAPINLVSSNEILLKDEMKRALRKTAKQKGAQERSVVFVDKGFCWDLFFSQQNNLSLLAASTYVEIHLADSKFDKAATDALSRYANHPNPQRILTFFCGKLTGAQKKSRWFAVFNQQGSIRELPSIPRAGFPRWLNARAQAMGLRLSKEAIVLIAEFSQGHLSAGAQALTKISLLDQTETISLDTIKAMITDNAQYTIYDLTDQLMGGHHSQALHCLAGLKRIGTEATLVLWAIHKMLQQLLSLSLRHQQGTPLQTLLKDQWASKRPLLQNALKKYNYRKLQQLLVACQAIDQSIKGLSAEDHWQQFEQLIVAFAND